MTQTQELQGKPVAIAWFTWAEQVLRMNVADSRIQLGKQGVSHFACVVQSLVHAYQCTVAGSVMLTLNCTYISIVISVWSELSPN